MEFLDWGTILHFCFLQLYQQVDVNTIELSKRHFTRMTAAYQIYDKISSETLGKPKLIQRLILKSITQKKA